MRLLFASLVVALASGLLLLTIVGKSESDSPLPPDKQAIVDREAKARSDALSQPLPPNARKDVEPYIQATATPWSPIAKVPAGAGSIVETGLAPFSSEEILVENQWQEIKDGNYVTVFAGASGGDHSQGLLIITAETVNGEHPIPSAGGGYLSPMKTGALGVVGADGERLTLASAGGATLFFDVASRLFASP